MSHKNQADSVIITETQESLLCHELWKPELGSVVLRWKWLLQWCFKDTMTYGCCSSLADLADLAIPWLANTL